MSGGGRRSRQALPRSHSSVLPRLLISVLPLLLALPARAQVPDTTAAPADTLRADTLRADTTAAADSLRPPRRLTEEDVVGFEAGPGPGRVVDEELPAARPVDAATDLLARAPGAFYYDFGVVGWPNGLSFQGRPPAQAALTLNGRPFDDPVTGRPRYDLLPLAFLRPLRTGPAAGLGAPHATNARLRPLQTGRPLTELRYQRGDGSLNGVAAVHAQRRRLRLFGTPFLASFAGGYIGRAADNFLPGSDLRRERRLLGRVRLQRPRFALELSALHNRRRLGAQGGVVLAGDLPLETIYNSAQVRHPNAERRIIRTDLAATLRLRLGLDPGGAPLTASAYWTPQTFRYRNPDADSTQQDTLEAQTDRYGLRLAQRLALRTERFGRHDLRLQAHAWTDRLAAGNALPSGDARSQLHLSARDSTRLLDMSAALGVGLHAGPVQTYPSASARLERAVAGGALRFFAEARLAGQPVAWIEEKGFGPLVQALPEGQQPGSVVSAEAGGQARMGPVQARLTVFFDRTSDRLDLYVTGSDSVQAAVAEGVFQRAGATLSARWRFRKERGFYATASATAFLNENDSPLFSRTVPVVPLAYGRGRLGARYQLFTGDLALDLYAEGRFWSQMKSRTLHAPTGRLAVPRAESRALGPSGILDLHAEATIRDATLFFSYENALSGTQVQAGALTVPFYPLPEQQFRFGVYWPIFG